MPDSVTSWLIALRRGDRVAAQNLWQRYFRQLLRLARRNLQTRIQTAAFDEEDVASAVLGELFVKYQGGGYRDVENRDSLWQLLVVVTIRKATTLASRERALKRGGGHVVPESQLGTPGQFRLDSLIGARRAAVFSDALSHECQALLEALADPDLERIALWKLAGYTNEQIARKQGCTRLTIQRKLRLIRKIWDAETGGLLSVETASGR